MGKEQVTEFETVEKEIDVYVCDECSCTTADPDEVTSVVMAPGYHESFEDGVLIVAPMGADYILRHFCEECIGYQSALRIDREVSMIRERWNAVTGKAAVVWALVFWVFGVLSVSVPLLSPRDDYPSYELVVDPVIGALAVICVVGMAFSCAIFIAIVWADDSDFFDDEYADI